MDSYQKQMQLESTLAGFERPEMTTMDILSSIKMLKENYSKDSGAEKPRNRKTYNPESNKPRNNGIEKPWEQTNQVSKHNTKTNLDKHTIIKTRKTYKTTTQQRQQRQQQRQRK